MGGGSGMIITEPRYDWAYSLTDRRVTTHLILHHAAGSGTPQDIHRIHLGKGWSGIAYHYYIRRDGTIYRGRPEAKQGGHTKDWNHCSIGICFEGNFETETMGDTQRDAGAALVGDIMERYPGIVIGGHREFGVTACPGRNFPMAEIKEGFMSYEKFKEHMARYNAELAEQAPGGWSAEQRAWAEAGGVMKGDDRGRMKYKSPITREEYITAEYNRAKGKPPCPCGEVEA